VLAAPAEGQRYTSHLVVMTVTGRGSPSLISVSAPGWTDF